MPDDDRREIDTFEEACLNVILDQPEAIGVAYKGLDCGCALICGTSADGRPLGPLQYVSGQPAPADGRPPICLKCKMDDGLAQRVVREGIYWPGNEDELPDPELRDWIGWKVFGARYRKEP